MAVEARSDFPKSDRARNQLQFLVVSGLNNSGKFQLVDVAPPADAAPHLVVALRIAELNQVSETARALVGALAGRASIVVDVELSDQ